MADPNGLTYAGAGVDIDAGNRTVDLIRDSVRSTRRPGAAAEIGGFGGLFALDLERFPAPVLVSSADGVGTKLKVAFELNIHHTVGQDLVNHCVNDIAVQGATPLFFLDYLATGRLEGSVAETVVSGISEACKANGCALIGGETAQMPGFYADGEYDLAGTVVGAVNREDIITGDKIEPGDCLIGLPSNGLHTNGYSLARRLLFDVAKYGPDHYVNELKDKTGAALMRSHRSYLSVLRKLIAGGIVHGMAHITGGGITENLPRILANCLAAHDQPSKGSPRDQHDAAMIHHLHQACVDWVILAGYMRVLTPAFIAAFPSRILNIHPSLLPAFPGLHAQRQALQAGVSQSGCTVHFVDEEVDHGTIVLQRAVPILDTDDEASLSARILAQEHRAYTEAIALVTARTEGDDSLKG